MQLLGLRLAARVHFLPRCDQPPHFQRFLPLSRNSLYAILTLACPQQQVLKLSGTTVSGLQLEVQDGRPPAEQMEQMKRGLKRTGESTRGRPGQRVSRARGAGA